jgi:pepF/M3 family oligoendopeptidase
MTPTEEDLAADLNLTGGRAWSKLYNTFSSQISAEVEVSGTMRTLPLTAIRNLAYDADRATRRRAFEAELGAWRRNAVPIAAALNSIKGQTNTLTRRRHWDEPLDVALFGNAIDRATLETMMDAARRHFPDFRRYLVAKARLLGIPKCAWYDLFAPVGAPDRSWSFGSARQFITEQFASFSPSLSSLATRAFAESWIDAEPRDGKRGGAFCMWAQADESRILSNFQASYGGMSTLAHELGHAYHNLCLAQRSPLQRQTPMTLAETASTFCQIIVRNAALRDADADEQMAILEADLQDHTQVIVDISSRFLFETQIFSRRRERELSPDEFCAIMHESQLATYGDSLEADTLHPYMWAVKPHYYGSVFYNFPYMFGLLFALGIYAHFRESAPGFVQRYEALLSSTGMEDAGTLARRFGIDLTRPDFWEASLSLIAADIDRFELLAKSTMAHARPTEL